MAGTATTQELEPVEVTDDTTQVEAQKPEPEVTTIEHESGDDPISQKIAEIAERMGSEDEVTEDGEAATGSDEQDSAGKRASGTKGTRTPTDVLTKNQHQALNRAGYSDDDIAELVGESPKIAKQTADHWARKLNEFSTANARRGRENQRANQNPGKDAGKPGAGEAESLDIDLPDRKAFVEEFGEKAADLLLPTMRAMAVRVKQAEDAARQTRSQATERQLVSEVQSFFQQQPKDFQTHFGKGNDAAKLTDDQREKRMEVVDQAALLLAGAEARGMEMSLTEALEKARTLVAGSLPARATRQRSAELHPPRGGSRSATSEGMDPISLKLAAIRERMDD